MPELLSDTVLIGSVGVTWSIKNQKARVANIRAVVGDEEFSSCFFKAVSWAHQDLDATGEPDGTLEEVEWSYRFRVRP